MQSCHRVNGFRYCFEHQKGSCFVAGCIHVLRNYAATSRAHCQSNQGDLLQIAELVSANWNHVIVRSLNFIFNRCLYLWACGIWIQAIYGCSCTSIFGSQPFFSRMHHCQVVCTSWICSFPASCTLQVLSRPLRSLITHYCPKPWHCPFFLVHWLLACVILNSNPGIIWDFCLIPLYIDVPSIDLYWSLASIWLIDGS